MSERRTPVDTLLGILSGRDAIYRDELCQASDTVSFSGEINTTLCSKRRPKKWVKYQLRFLGTVSYRASGIDYYQAESHSASSFDMVEESSWQKQFNVRGITHYVLSTYDFIYEILARNFQLELGEERDQESLSSYKSKLDGELRYGK